MLRQRTESGGKNSVLSEAWTGRSRRLSIATRGEDDGSSESLQPAINQSMSHSPVTRAHVLRDRLRQLLLLLLHSATR